MTTNPSGQDDRRDKSTESGETSYSGSVFDTNQVSDATAGSANSGATPPSETADHTAASASGATASGAGAPADAGTAASGYGASNYSTPGYSASGYGHGTSAHGTPDYGTPDYGTPDYGTPGYDASAYGAGSGPQAYATPYEPSYEERVRQAQYQAAQQVEAMANYRPKSLTVSYLLWFFLGGVGGHAFYLRRKSLGIFHVFSSVFYFVCLFFTFAKYAQSGLILDLPTYIELGSSGNFGVLPLISIWVYIVAWLVLIVSAFLIPSWCRKLNEEMQAKLNPSFGYGNPGNFGPFPGQFR
ncbi:NINE protein [Actinobaculum suis]|uniref:NINE protein n=1 Tax=Actinobaculum suis TaxID=1657 RepID=UPI00066FCB62|nr:NINE protein [Actinobaculum suis]